MKEKKNKSKAIWRRVLVSIIATIASIAITLIRGKSVSWVMVFLFLYYFVLLSISEGESGYHKNRFWYTLLLSIIVGTVISFPWSGTSTLLNSLGMTIMIFPILMVIVSIICALCKDSKKLQGHIKKRRQNKENKRHWEQIFNEEIQPSDREKLIMKAVNWWKRELSHTIEQETGDAICNGFFDLMPENSKKLTKEQVYAFGVDLAHAISKTEDDHRFLRTDWHPCEILYDIAKKRKIRHINFPLRMEMDINFKNETISIRHLDEPEWTEIWTPHKPNNREATSPCGFFSISNIHF